MTTARARAIIRGKVQGVFFRVETKKAADRCGGISGWVKNLPDGSVEAVFEGDEQAVARMLEWCKKGPPRSSVTAVDTTREDPTGEFREFRIAY